MAAYGDHTLPPKLAGLEMGPLLGSGSFAKGAAGSSCARPCLPALRAWLGGCCRWSGEQGLPHA